MRLNDTKVALLFCIVAPVLLAQQPGPSAAPALSPPAAPPAAATRPQPAGYLRAWDFAQSFKEPVELTLIGAGSAPVTLAYAAKSGQFGSYRQLPPGRYRLSVRTANLDAIKPGTAAPPANRNPELMPGVTIDVADGSFQTLVLRDEQGAAKVSLINDAVAPANAGKRLRVFNFSAAEAPALKVLSTNEVLWPQVPQGMSEHKFPNDTKALNLALVTKLPNGRESRQITEADYSSAASISIAISGDRDGTVTMQSFVDARE